MYKSNTINEGLFCKHKKVIIRYIIAIITALILGGLLIFIERNYSEINSKHNIPLMMLCCSVIICFSYFYGLLLAKNKIESIIFSSAIIIIPVEFIFQNQVLFFGSSSKEARICEIILCLMMVFCTLFNRSSKPYLSALAKNILPMLLFSIICILIFNIPENPLDKNATIVFNLAMSILTVGSFIALNVKHLKKKETWIIIAILLVINVPLIYFLLFIQSLAS